MRQRQSAVFVGAAACALVVLSACGGGRDGGTAPLDFSGGAVADEPQAALVAREILDIGGTAADAAAALYFALAVTMPATAGLGGGGMCVVYDPKLNRTEALDFVARAPAEGGSVALPGNAAGMFALQGKYGRLRWAQVVAPAERMARDGVRVSRAMAADLAQLAATSDPLTRQRFARGDGTPLGEGEVVAQRELASVLTALRTRGTIEVYGGTLGEQFALGAAALGGRFTLAELRQIRPAFRATVPVRFDGLSLHFAPPPATAGLASAQMWRMLEPRWRRARDDERPHLLAEAGLRVAASRDRWERPDLSAAAAPGELIGDREIDAAMASYQPDRRAQPASLRTPANRPEGGSPASGFVVADSGGGAVACAVTLHKPLGVGRLIAGLGFAPAAVPDGAGAGPQAMSPMLAVRGSAGQFVMAASATGGPAAASALAEVALRALVDERPLEEAIAAPRVQFSGAPDTALVEDAGAGLARLGYRLQQDPALGRVNAILCPGGLVAAPGRCQFRADRRGAGMAASGL